MSLLEAFYYLTSFLMELEKSPLIGVSKNLYNLLHLYRSAWGKRGLRAVGAPWLFSRLLPEELENFPNYPGVTYDQKGVPRWTVDSGPKWDLFESEFLCFYGQYKSYLNYMFPLCVSESQEVVLEVSTTIRMPRLLTKLIKRLTRRSTSLG